MTPELETGELKNLHYSDFVLPDGTECGWVFAGDSVGETKLVTVAETLAQMSSLSGKEFRLRAESEVVNKVGERLVRVAPPNVEIHWGGNRFFEHDLRRVLSENLEWQNYQAKFSIALVLSERDGPEILEGLMLESFGTTEEKKTKIRGILPRALRDSSNYIYMVQEKRGGKVLGVFVMKYVNQEVQLHSLAGKSDDPRVIQEKGKLPVLVAAILAMARLNYPEVTKMTFSASGRVVSLYEGLGFEQSDQAGILIKPKDA